MPHYSEMNLWYYETFILGRIILKKYKLYDDFIWIKLKLIEYQVMLLLINKLYRTIYICEVICSKIQSNLIRIDTYKKYSVIVNLTKIILKLPFIIILVIPTINSISSNIEIVESILNIIIFILYVYYIKEVLKKERQFSHKNKDNIKYVYKIFGGFYIICVSISFSKNYIISNCLNYMISNYYMSCILVVIKKILHVEFDGYSVLKISWGILNSLKEAVLAAIIFDTAYQMYNFNLVDSFKRYLDILASKYRLYILPEDSEKETPRIWYILGDCCSDIIEEAGKYHLKSDNNLIIKYSNEQAEEIIEKRKELFKYDRDISFYCDDSEYYFSFMLLDFSKVLTINFSMKDIMEIIGDRLIKLPIGIEVNDNEGVLKKRKYLIMKLRNRLILDSNICRIMLVGKIIN